MDPFTEKQLIENLQLISGTLMGIKAEIADLNVAIREMNEIEFDEKLSESEDDDDLEDSEDNTKKSKECLDEDKEKTDLEEADEGFVVAEEDTVALGFKDDSESEENSGDSF